MRKRADLAVCLLLTGSVLHCGPRPGPVGSPDSTNTSEARDTEATTDARVAPECLDDDQDGDGFPDTFDTCPEKPGALQVQDPHQVGCPMLLLLRSWSDVRYFTFSLRLCPDVDSLPESTAFVLTSFGEMFEREPTRPPVEVTAWIMRGPNRGVRLAEARSRAAMVRDHLVRAGAPSEKVGILLIDPKWESPGPRYVNRVDVVGPVGPSLPPTIIDETHPPQPPKAQEEPIQRIPLIPPVIESSARCEAHNQCVVDHVRFAEDVECSCERPYARHENESFTPPSSPVEQPDEALETPNASPARSCGPCPPALVGGRHEALCVDGLCTLVR